MHLSLPSIPTTSWLIMAHTLKAGGLSPRYQSVICYGEKQGGQENSLKYLESKVLWYLPFKWCKTHTYKYRQSKIAKWDNCQIQVEALGAFLVLFFHNKNLKEKNVCWPKACSFEGCHPDIDIHIWPAV